MREPAVLAFLLRLLLLLCMRFVFLEGNLLVPVTGDAAGTLPPAPDQRPTIHAAVYTSVALRRCLLQQQNTQPTYPDKV